MPQVIFYMQAYNTEKTIERALDSLLHQTCKDWICYCVDNGCTDRTGKIIERYAHLDSRIKLQRVMPNNPGFWVTFLPTLVENHPEEDLFTTLDADDEYMPTFVEEMMTFVQRNRLEIAACGNYFSIAATGKIVRERVLSDNLILETSSQFSQYFPAYQQFLRTIWGKLYAISILRKISWERLNISMYGADTLFCLENLSHASRIGILGKTLHKYYLSPKSVSHQWDQKRILSDRILHEATRDFLIEKCGTVSRQNEDYQLAVYTNAIRDTLNVLINASIPLREKIEGVIDIANNTYTQQLIAREEFCFNSNAVQEMFKMRKDVVSAAANWLLSLNEVPDDLIEGYCNTGELLCASVENADGWLHFKKLRVHFFLEQNRKEEAKKSLQELSELIPNDLDVMDFQKCF
ncbi:MAG TPA: glycosyltransferase family 2 protein [Clostridia bacterium]|nr:glycosyltransferase family 2 protein [Clostridia bacterium]